MLFKQRDIVVNCNVCLNCEVSRIAIYEIHTFSKVIVHEEYVVKPLMSG